MGLNKIATNQLTDDNYDRFRLKNPKLPDRF